MEYAIIIFIYILGSGFSVRQEIGKLRIKFPDCDKNMIISTFFKEEWDSIFGSVIILALYLTFWFIIHYRHINIAPWFHEWGVFALSLGLSYWGQRVLFKALTTSEKVISKKIDDAGNQN